MLHALVKYDGGVCICCSYLHTMYHTLDRLTHQIQSELKDPSYATQKLSRFVGKEQARLLTFQHERLKDLKEGEDGVQRYADTLRRNRWCGPTEGPYIATLFHQALAVYERAQPGAKTLNLVDWSHRHYTSAECRGDVDIQLHVSRLLYNGKDHYNALFDDDECLCIAKSEVQQALEALEPSGST